MADSDYDYEEDASDDEYIGTKAAASSRGQTAERKRRPQEKVRKTHAWERRKSEAEAEEEYEYELSDAEVEDETLKQSAQEREEERKRKR